MQDFERKLITGKAVAVSGNDIDTDRIIPARYLRCVTFDGLGEHAFEDDRKQLAEAGQRHPLDDPRRADATVLVVGRNFGCGSSREHAPQALMRWGRGLRAIVGESFAEIFFGNCVALGIPCLAASAADLRELSQAVEQDPELEVAVDVDALKVRFGSREIPVSLSEGARTALTSGRWDSTQELLAGKQAVTKTAGKLPYFTW